VALFAVTESRVSLNTFTKAHLCGRCEYPLLTNSNDFRPKLQEEMVDLCCKNGVFLKNNI
jgi:RNase P subunit RPR2